jgi:hypothetical protein
LKRYGEIIVKPGIDIKKKFLKFNFCIMKLLNMSEKEEFNSLSEFEKYVNNANTFALHKNHIRKAIEAYREKFYSELRGEFYDAEMEQKEIE